MSTPVGTLPPERWRYSRRKLYGWLAGLGFMVFGGMLCVVPVGVFMGAPVAAIGIFITISFALSMSWAPISAAGALGLVACGVVLMDFGRWAAAEPLEALTVSFREVRTVIKHLTPLMVSGIPLLLVGTSLVGLAVPWVRRGRPFGFVRGPVALTLIHTAVITVLIGVILLKPSAALADQPVWAWVGSTLALALGVGLRCEFRGWAWPTLVALVALAMPLAWALLLLGPRIGAP
jgi:hypothetical protein